MIKVAIESSIPYIEGLLDKFCSVLYIPYKDFTSSSIKDCDAIIIRSTINCNESLLKGTNVRYISTATAGFDHIDIAYCNNNGILWNNCKGCNCESVAQYVISVICHLIIDLGYSIDRINLGIVGVGYTGGAVNRIATKLGIKTVLCDPIRAKQGIDKYDYKPIDHLFRFCNIITLHTPITKTGSYPTYHMINNSLLCKSSCKPVIINACRGGVFNTKDILESHKKGFISSPVVDCWENEPDINEELLDISFLASPHIAGFSADSKLNATIMACNNVLSWAKLPNISKSYINIEEPVNSKILLQEKLPFQLEKAILCTTNLKSVSESLKSSKSFYEVRRNYKMPREFNTYRIVGLYDECVDKLKSIGFQINE